MAKYEVVLEDSLIKVSVDLFLSPDAIAKLDDLRNNGVVVSGVDLSMDSFINTIVDSYIASH